MESFFALSDETAGRYAAFRDSPSRATQEALWQISGKAGRLFDLSQVPPATRRKVADETFYLLWEVLARVKLPNLEDIPGAAAYTNGDKQTKPLTRWRVPGTEVTIARIEEGPRAGEFLFSSDTVKQAWAFYKASRELPYLRPIPIDNVYRLNQLVTGWMIPLAWVEALPDWANTAMFGQVLWKWFVLLLLIGLAIAAVIAVFRWTRRKIWDGSFWSYLRNLSTPLAILVFAGVVAFFATYQLNVTGAAAEVPDYVRGIANGVAVVWIVWLTARRTAEAIIASPRTRTSSQGLDASLLRLGARAVGILAVTVVVFRVAHDVGIPVYGLVAGAGVGGLAIAMAARSTLEGFLDTLSLYADRPVQVGDFCRYGEDPSSGWLRIGTVEEIGLRSTRIRGIDRTITTIPNAEFSKVHIVNLSKRDRMLWMKSIALRKETTPDQLRFVLAALREMLLSHPRINKDPARVRASDIGEYSVDVEIFAYVNTSDWNDFLAVKEDLILRTMDIVKGAGTAFAVPARTVYHTRDTELDDGRQQAAEKQVREWASAHTLPFPEFADEYRKQITDTLDYPPEGSPGADREE